MGHEGTKTRSTSILSDFVPSWRINCRENGFSLKKVPDLSFFIAPSGKLPTKPEYRDAQALQKPALPGLFQQ